MLLAYKNDIIFRFTYGNLRELRALTYQGEGLGFTSYPKYIELFLIPMRTFANMSYVMIFIFSLVLHICKNQDIIILWL